MGYLAHCPNYGLLNGRHYSLWLTRYRLYSHFSTARNSPFADAPNSMEPTLGDRLATLVNDPNCQELRLPTR
jgi:hypothetical protein